MIRKNNEMLVKHVLPIAAKRLNTIGDWCFGDDAAKLLCDTHRSLLARVRF